MLKFPEASPDGGCRALAAPEGSCEGEKGQEGSPRQERQVRHHCNHQGLKPGFPPARVTGLTNIELDEAAQSMLNDLPSLHILTEGWSRLMEAGFLKQFFLRVKHDAPTAAPPPVDRS